jgi:hypothetical protein
VAYQPIAAGTTPTADEWNGYLLPGVLVFRAFLNTSQSVPTRSAEAVADALVWDTIDLDRLSGWAAGANASRWTCTVPGWYTFSGSVGYNASSAGTFREAIWFQNGALSPAGRATPMMSTAIAATPLTAEARTLSLSLSAGDYMQLVPLQNAGAALTTATGSLRSFMSATYAGPP